MYNQLWTNLSFPIDAPNRKRSSNSSTSQILNSPLYSVVRYVSTKCTTNSELICLLESMHLIASNRAILLLKNAQITTKLCYSVCFHQMYNQLWTNLSSRIDAPNRKQSSNSSTSQILKSSPNSVVRYVSTKCTTNSELICLLESMHLIASDRAILLPAKFSIHHYTLLLGTFPPNVQPTLN